MNPNAGAFVPTLNPNAGSFVPRFLPAQQPMGQQQQAPPQLQTQSGFQPTAQSGAGPVHAMAPVPSKEASWEDQGEDKAQPTFHTQQSKSDEPPKPTESVFKIEEDDLEDDEPEEIIHEVKKMDIAKHAVVEEASDPREHLNVVFIGHVDAGKSTISGQIMVITGQVDKRTLEKYERDAKDNNRESWVFAYIMDTSEDERAKGKTVEVGRAHFETEKKRYTILDAPGHKNYVPNMIGGAAQADVAILVISARRGEFETGFEKGGQTREHARLVKTIGVRYLIVVINKMDDPTVNWEKERFDECVDKLTPFLKNTGYNVKKDIMFIPISGMTAANLKDHSTAAECPWYTGPTMLEALDNLNAVERKSEAPLRIPVVDSYKDRGLTIVMGKIESGSVAVGQTIFLMPGKIPLEVTGISTESAEIKRAKPGENVKIAVRGVEEGVISSGFVLSDGTAQTLVPCVSEFEAVLAVQELTKEKSLLTAGYEAVIHIHTAAEECTISELVSQIDPKTNKEIKKKPTFVKSNSMVKCRIQLSKPTPMETFATLPQLGRFTLRDATKTIAMGKVVAVGPKKLGGAK